MAKFVDPTSGHLDNLSKDQYIRLAKQIHLVATNATPSVMFRAADETTTLNIIMS